MRRLLLVVLFMLSSIVLSAQTPTMLPGDSIAFDYSDTAYQEYQVLRFEVRWDTQTTWNTVNSAPFRDAATQAGFSSYSVAPPFSSGNHQAYFRTCNSVGCGASSNPFTFAFAVNSAPVDAPSNIRVKRAGQ